MPHIEMAAWDTECFGYPVGRILIPEDSLDLLPGLLKDAKKQDYRLVYITLENAGHQSKELVAEIFSRLEKINVSLADEKVFFQQVIKEHAAVLPGNISAWKAGMSQETLTGLALQAGEYSRFCTDKNFTAQEFEKMYTRWIQSSIDNKLAGMIYVSLWKDMINGMVTLTKKTDHINIGLIAVDRASRGKGIGKSLLEAAAVFALSQNLRTIRLSTQLANKPAMAFYASRGFEITGVDLVFHCWL
jgi:dTDP-4-amino-4,6-dideoxy-D-galactose acyltransferase